MATRALRIILGDQLSSNISSLHGMDEHDLVLMMEVHDETTYVPHHQQKLVFILSAMRHFAHDLSKKYRVKYLKLDERCKRKSFTDGVAEVVRAESPQRIIITFPGEYRVLEMIQQWEQQFSVPVEIREDDRFFSQPQEFVDWAKGKKQLRMEHFYRQLRIKTGLLMDKDKPVGGQWNFDKANRKKLPKNIKLPHLKAFKPDDITTEVMALVSTRFSDNLGHTDSFEYATTRRQALMALDDFIEHRLVLFGDYQDAMKKDEMTLFHSVLSQYLNVGLLLPHEVCERAERAYEAQRAPLNAVEGFIRQILGWREYVRGIYWMSMPDYPNSNYFKAHRKLPDFYWTGETDMACVSHSVKQTLATAQSHHIQRLMVTGNFALLYGVDPKHVCTWYLAVYLDAFEWVELPNTHGMSQFADGGILASKPYIASGKYIDRMSDFCQHCRFDVKKRTGDNACPFNVLYWDFLLRHQDKLAKNPRMTLALKHLDKLSKNDIKTIQEQANKIIEG